MLMVPQVVRAKALNAGAEGWLDNLPGVIADLEQEWVMRVGQCYADSTEAYVAEALLADGTPAVLKLVVPRAEAAALNEITALRLGNGRGCVRLLRYDVARGALLLERLGRSLSELQLPLKRRHAILCSLARQVWRSTPRDCRLPTGADKGRWLTTYITTAWDALHRPCSERTIDYALDCAARRTAAYAEERAKLVHGDVHQWNALEAPRSEGFALVDPDGLLSEPEYDLGIIMREDPLELLEEGPHQRALWLADQTGLDAAAIWEWGVVERVSTGLLCTSVGLQPVGRDMLAVADHIAAEPKGSRDISRV